MIKVKISVKAKDYRLALLCGLTLAGNDEFNNPRWVGTRKQHRDYQILVNSK